MIELYNVSTIYEGERKPVLKNVTLTIETGAFVTVVGANGAGKTTLLETINGLLPCEGMVTVCGADIKNKGSTIRKQIGYVPQEFTCDSLTPFLVKDVVLMGRYGKIGLLRTPQQKDYTIVKKTMEFLSISSLKDTPIGKLSGGQLQKVLICRAVAKEPKILLLDEPFSNLDMESRTEVSHKLMKLHQEGLTLVMVVHDRSSIPGTCQRIITIEHGEIIGDKKLKLQVT
jgi:zinc/manganese transport system ATP-binding protein